MLPVDEEVDPTPARVDGVGVGLGHLDRQTRRVELPTQGRVAEPVDARADRVDRVPEHLEDADLTRALRLVLDADAIERGVSSIRARSSMAPKSGVQPYCVACASRTTSPSRNGC
jgi:hypothetical protein